MTIQNKIYECMAMKKPVLTGESPAINDSFHHGINIYVCKREDPRSICESIIDLLKNPCIIIIFLT